LLNWSGQKKMKKITGLEFLAILFNSFIGSILLIDAIRNGSNGYIYTAAICLISSFIAGYMFQFHREINELKGMYKTEVECNLKQREKIAALEIEIDEKYQELAELRQKHSRTNQPRSGGRFVKKDKSLKAVALDNIGISIILDNGIAGVVCGYDSSCELNGDKPFIIGLDEHQNRGWNLIDQRDVIFDGCEYPRYWYIEYQDILNSKL